MEKGVLGLLQAQNDLNHYSTMIWTSFISSPLTVPSVCYHFLLGTMSIITKLVDACTISAQVLLLTSQTMGLIERWDSISLFKWTVFRGKVECPLFFKRREGMVYICATQGHGVQKPFNVNLFHFQRTKMKVIERIRLSGKVITFFSNLQRNSNIFSEMTQFALWYAPLNVSGQTSLPCIVCCFFFLPVRMPTSHLWLIWALISQSAKCLHQSCPSL